MKKERPLEYVEVPARTRATECRGKTCRATIYYVERPSRAKGAPADKLVRVPVDCEANDQCHEPTETEPGMGVNHFMTCPDANRF